MKMSFISGLILVWFTSLNHIYSQALYQVSIDEKIVGSSHIIEGKVLQQKSFWNPRHTMIYTSNKVEVYKTFKGTLLSGTVEIMTTGGTVGLESIEASDLLTLEKGNIGLFFCFPNSIRLLSPFTGKLLFDVYSGAQGCFTYDLNSKMASAPFVRYASIENELYKELVKKTGRLATILNPAFNISAQAKPQTPFSPVITSFSPQIVNAGATLDPLNNLLTIDGSGFGNTPGDSAGVLFDDANDGPGGNFYEVFFNSPLTQSWTDNQIKLRVPGRAGTGYFAVMSDQSVSAASPGILSVNYAVLNREFTSGGVTVVKEMNLMSGNGSGGYTVLYSTGTLGGGVDLSLAPEKETFLRALNTWKEVAGFNVVEGGTTSNQSVAADGSNLILFDNSNTGNTPLAAGVLAVCYSYSNICPPLISSQIQKTEFDIVIRNSFVSTGSASITNGPCPPETSFAQSDLETVLLHELGHALNLAHVNDGYEGSSLPNVNPGKLMYYAILNGVSRKTPDHSALSGALYCINPRSNEYGSCSLSNVEMTPLNRTVAANDECPLSFPVDNMAPNTAVGFDLVNATSNAFADPAYTGINCEGTGTSVTNNAYYAIKSGHDGANLSITVSGYTTFPASVQGSCTGSGVRFAIYQVNGCPAGQSFPLPVACRTILGDGVLPVIEGLTPGTNYLIYVDGINNTKANFTLTLNGTVLPLTLFDFKGNILNNMVSLSWKATREINSREFLVEKSVDGATFNQFAVVASKGSYNIENRYGVTDDKPYADNTFYRLKMVDKDGHFQYSPIVKVRIFKRAIVVGRIFPNPVLGKLNFQLVVDSSKILTMEIFDIAGKMAAKFTISVEKGYNVRAIPVYSLASGTYFFRVKDAVGNLIYRSKFIKD